jgi:hypothetical protein
MKPPRKIPPGLEPAFTVNGKIAVDEWYIDGTTSPEHRRVYNPAQVNPLIEKARRRTQEYYGLTDELLYSALDAYPIQAKSVAVMGSVVPWYESICISRGAGKITTIEYADVISEVPEIRVITPAEYDQAPERFDAAISISSFEHDGLGRYGDPINPRGDLDAMHKMTQILKPGGILFLAVPVGMDKLVWNAHRIYGKIRLPMLLEGWNMLVSYGFDEHMLDTDTANLCPWQPVFVLENIRG